jgi:hypothetical protein
MLNYHEPSRSTIAKKFPAISKIILLISLFFVILSIALSVLVTYSRLWPIPTGSQFRDFEWIGKLIIIGAVTFAISTTLSIVTLVLGYRREFAIGMAVTLVGTTISLFAGLATARWIVIIHHLRPGP